MASLCYYAVFGRHVVSHIFFGGGEQGSFLRAKTHFCGWRGSWVYYACLKMITVKMAFARFFLRGNEHIRGSCPQIKNKKLSYRRETARQLPTWRGLSPPVHSPLCMATPIYAYGRIRNPQQTYVKRAVRKAHFKLNRAFKVIQGYPYLWRQEPRAVYCRNVQLMPPLYEDMATGT